MIDWYELEARLTAGVSERMLELAGIGPGMSVLDLATGKGEPLVRIAERVGPGGRVVGVDPWVEALESNAGPSGRLGPGNVAGGGRRGF
jgi:ubiquinone/menaquinone biosynthesis C-methylase UbiE